MDATIRDVFTILNFLSSHGYKPKMEIRLPKELSLFFGFS